MPFVRTLPVVFVAFVAVALPLAADLAWLDVDDPAGTTAPFHTSLAAAAGAAATAGGVTFTLSGEIDGSRDRGLADPLLSDFAFNDGEGAAIVLRLDGLPPGDYQVESWHWDGAGFAGAVQVELRPQDGAATVLVDEFEFSTSPAAYQITSGGAGACELVFTEAGANNRSRLNGLRIRAAGAPVAPPLAYVDADDANTVALAGTPAPFWTTLATTDDLWRMRAGYGFDVLANREVFEKDAAGVGDAAPLVTTITGLVPGRAYGVWVCFLSVPTEAWRVRAGLDSGALTEFQPGSPAERVTNLGLSSEPNSNRCQYLGFLGNADADPAGAIAVHVDDGEGGSPAARSWYEGVATGPPHTPPEPPPLPGGAVEVAPDGAWTWFNDERAIFHQGFLFAGYVLRDGRYGVTRFDPATATASHAVISTTASQQKDDHNNPSLTPLPDGRLLAVYSKHGGESRYYHRTSLVATPATAADWGPEQAKATPAGTTYANTFLLAAEADTVFNFHRCINFNPTLTLSADLGASWGTPAHFIDTGGGGTRPYPRFCSNHLDRIDLVYTDGHPRDVDNSVYHLFYRGGAFRTSDGTVAASLAELPLDHDAGQRGTTVYPFSAAAWGPGQGPDDWIPGGRGWTWDVHHGPDGRPVCAFQVQQDDVAGTGWNHDRIYYYYARWTGTAWQRRLIAHGGRGLYQAEDDYGGGMAIDPADPRVVYVSTNAADPFDLSGITDVPLAPGERYEIWRGFTADGGLTFHWSPVTAGSAADNLRPIVPERHGRTRHLLWFHGTYTSYTNFNTRVLGVFDEPALPLADWQASFGLAGTDPAADTDRDGLADLLEYALGGDPTDAADRPAPTLADGGFRFRHLPARTGAECVVEASTDLQSWSPLATIRAAGLPAEVAAGFTLASDGGDPAMLTLTPAPPPAGPRSFVRLRVHQTP